MTDAAAHLAGMKKLAEMDGLQSSIYKWPTN